MKKILFIATLIFGLTSMQAQNKVELIAKQSVKKDSIKVLQGKVDAIQSEIDGIPGWRFKIFGTIGGNVSGFNNWYSKEIPNSSVGNFGINLNARADLIEDKFFWKNYTNINVGWVKFDNKDDNSDNSNYEVATDIFTLSSLYGYNLNKKIAASALGEYRSTLVQNFNNPGFLDLGIGITWTPLKDLLIVIHPLNYNFVFSSGDNNYNSSLGAKIVADYAKKFGGFNFKTNLSLFQSYETSNYSNFTWTNTIAYTLWKNFGLGFDFGLRKNKQEALNFIQATDPNATFNTIDNKLQSYWLFGLNFNFE